MNRVFRHTKAEQTRHCEHYHVDYKADLELKQRLVDLRPENVLSVLREVSLSHDSKAAEKSIHSKENEEDHNYRRDHSSGRASGHVEVDSGYIDLEGERVQENREG